MIYPTIKDAIGKNHLMALGRASSAKLQWCIRGAVFFPLILACIMGLGFSQGALAQSKSDASALWPQIPFVRGKDLCQYSDSYSRGRSAQLEELVYHVKDLVFLGSTAPEAATSLAMIDGMIEQHRLLASSTPGWDVTLEAAIKSSLDQINREINPRVRRIGFAYSGSLTELLANLREQRSRGPLSPAMLQKISGVAWGTYSFASGCKGDIFLTLHVELRNGEIQSFSALGPPERAAHAVAVNLFKAFQVTQFPSSASILGKRIELLGSPSGGVCVAPSPEIAQKACRTMGGRLPTAEEYEQLSLLGSWSGGVDLGNDLWALADSRVLAPELRNPSPVRKLSEFPGQSFRFYCVR